MKLRYSLTRKISKKKIGINYKFPKVNGECIDKGKIGENDFQTKQRNKSLVDVGINKRKAASKIKMTSNSHKIASMVVDDATYSQGKNLKTESETRRSAKRIANIDIYNNKKPRITRQTVQDLKSSQQSTEIPSCSKRLNQSSGGVDSYWLLLDAVSYFDKRVGCKHQFWPESIVDFLSAPIEIRYRAGVTAYGVPENMTNSELRTYIAAYILVVFGYDIWNEIGIFCPADDMCNRYLAGRQWHIGCATNRAKFVLLRVSVVPILAELHLGQPIILFRPYRCRNSPALDRCITGPVGSTHNQLSTKSGNNSLIDKDGKEDKQSEKWCYYPPWKREETAKESATVRKVAAGTTTVQPLAAAVVLSLELRESGTISSRSFKSVNSKFANSSSTQVCTTVVEKANNNHLCNSGIPLDGPLSEYLRSLEIAVYRFFPPLPDFFAEDESGEEAYLRLSRPNYVSQSETT